MRIGDVATATGLETQAIRFYERKGLLPPPGRSPNGYRVYDAATITRLEFIRSGQGAGLTLAEIATILDLRDDGDTPCAHVRALLTAKLRDVHTRQQQLGALETELQALLSRSANLDPADCADAEICRIMTPPPVGEDQQDGTQTEQPDIDRLSSLATSDAAGDGQRVRR